MQRAIVILLLLPALQGLGAGTLYAQTRWNVISNAKIDSRISAEIRRLALRHHAQVIFRIETRETTPSEKPGTFTLELDTPESLDSFAQRLREFVAQPPVEITSELAREGYTLTASSTNTSRPYFVKVQAATPAGFHYALLRLPEVLRPATQMNNPGFPIPRFSAVTRRGRSVVRIVADFPSFPERGIVEGFYGKPWSHAERLAMLRFEGAHRMNVYYYAPKDDPYHRALWRKPYPPARMKQLGELAMTARANFVDFCFAISPGLSMTYSSDADFEHLADKLQSVRKLGVSCFALFLDDVPPVLKNPQDQAQYKTLAAAHVDLTNRLYAFLKSQSKDDRLVVTPTTYTNAWGSRDYIRELGQGVNPDIPIVWTGTQVVSPEITVAQAKEWGALLRRKPLVWDNFPVNDGVPWRVNLGPLRGRDAELPTAIRGIFSNPMNQAEASKLPLQTISEYLWNAASYDPDAAYQRALIDQYGRLAPRELKTFLETFRDYWWDENIFYPLFAERRYEFDTHRIEQRLTELTRELTALRQHARYRKLIPELAPLLPQTRSRLTEVLASEAFDHLPDGKLLWREDYDTFEAPRIATPPKLDGDFSKWLSGRTYTLNQRGQLLAGQNRWTGPDQFSVRYALRWDDQFLYLGFEVTDTELYQPYVGRDIGKGDVISLSLETAFRKNFLSTRADGDEYQLLFSPGDFAGVPPSVYSSEDYLPLRPIPRDYEREIKTAWKKTSTGFSGDIVLPAAWFDGGKFYEGYEVGLIVSAQKAFPPPPGASMDSPLRRILFRSKIDRLFPALFGNPATYQRVILR